ncbi:MAG: 3-dehydroquinate synthase [Candidatus Omnitrophota bacterium]
MKVVKVDLGKRGYDIFIGSGAVTKLPRIVSEISENAPAVIITDRNVISGSGKILGSALKKIKNPVVKIVLEPGERSKSFKVFSGTVNKIASATRGHKPVIVAVGGGVVGDLAGFVASSYRRGVPLVQVPTTLLAQVDSSIGGKAGIDLPEAKNIVGAFYQPRVVLSDVDFLASLPSRQISNGMAEVVKYSVIKSPGMFVALEKNAGKIRALDKRFMEKIVGECAEIKAGIVKKDELDTMDIRIILNYGHTLGHALETASGYSDLYNHGESVSVGMLMAGEIALRLGIFAKRDLGRLEKLLFELNLPVRIKKVNGSKILDACKYDKKFTSGKTRFVLPCSIGKVKVVEDVPPGMIRSVVSCFMEKR